MKFKYLVQRKFMFYLINILPDILEDKNTHEITIAEAFTKIVKFKLSFGSIFISFPFFFSFLFSFLFFLFKLCRLFYLFFQHFRSPKNVNLYFICDNKLIRYLIIFLFCLFNFLCKKVSTSFGVIESFACFFRTIITLKHKS